jgi:endonuclease III
LSEPDVATRIADDRAFGVEDLMRTEKPGRDSQRARNKGSRIPALLTELESFYGKQEPWWPTDPYYFLIWWHCGYPASDATCAKGWDALNQEIGVEPQDLLAVSRSKLATPLRAGGMVPDLRARRLQDIAARVTDKYDGDLAAALAGPADRARKMLKTFPGIADPGADRMLLWSGIAAVAAVPSNCPHVLVRIQRGLEGKDYGRTYREAQEAIEAELPGTFEPRKRAYLLLKRHGQDLCKRTKPKCPECPVRAACAFFTGSQRVQ